MAKRHKQHIVTASFHYLVKTARNDDNINIPHELPFSEAEFQRIVRRVSNTARLDERDENVINNIKAGFDLPFNYHDVVDGYLHFGEFEGAYYGHEYRNNRVGTISAESLNLRKFHYLVTRLRDGKILIGVTYNGQFGDYDGIKSCFRHLLNTNENIASRTIKSISDELGNGEPVEVKLTFRKAADRVERRGLFGHSGVIAIKSSDYGPGFREEVQNMARGARGDYEVRRRAIASLVNDSEMLELNDDDIIGCSAIVRERGRTRTVYFLGDNNFSTKYHLQVELDHNGNANRDQVKAEIIRVMRQNIMPILAG